MNTESMLNYIKYIENVILEKNKYLLDCIYSDFEYWNIKPIIKNRFLLSRLRNLKDNIEYMIKNDEDIKFKSFIKDDMNSNSVQLINNLGQGLFTSATDEWGLLIAMWSAETIYCKNQIYKELLNFYKTGEKTTKLNDFYYPRADYVNNPNMNA